LKVRLMPGENAGTSLSTAIGLNAASGSQSWRDRVDTLNPNDYYRFSLDSITNLSLSVQSLSSDATLQLLNGRGTVLQSSTNTGLAAEAIATTLDPGTYYIRVSAALPTPGTDYSLNLNLQTNANFDLYWRDTATGNNTRWSMTAGLTPAIQANDPVRFVNAGWQMAAVADFNRDGTLDLLWREPVSGTNGIWLMGGDNGSSIASIIALPIVNGSWRIEGVADFNHDGAIDLLWRHYNSGETGIWFMSPTNPAAIASVGALPGIGGNWRVEGTTDFNGDGAVDLLWREATIGTTAIWLMSGSNPTAIASVVLLDPRSPNWGIEGVADINRDGTPDILWRDYASGKNEVAFLGGANRTTVIGTAAIAPTPTSWQAIPVIRSGVPAQADLAGNTPEAAFDVGVLSRAALYQETVGPADANDYYRFTLDTLSTFSLSLRGLTADADVQLLRSDGSLVRASLTPGIASESINATLDAGTYLIRIFSYNRPTGYTLNLSSSAIASGLTTVNLTVPDANAAETRLGEVANPGQFRLTRTGSTATALTVNLALSGTATNGSDYATLPTSIVIPVGQSSVTLPVNILDDALLEGNETLIVTLAAGNGYSLGTSRSGTLTIADNDFLAFTNFTVTDASGDGTPNTVFQGGALQLSYSLPGIVPIAQVRLEALQNNQVVTTLGTWTTLSQTGTLINLNNLPLLGGDYQLRAIARTTSNQDIISPFQPFKVLSWNATSGTTFGSYTADTLTYTGTAGKGQIFVGRGGTDTLDLGRITRANVASLNGNSLNTYTPLNSTTNQALFRGTAFDVLTLQDGREIYFQGIESLKFADGSVSLQVTPNDSNFGKQWNLHVTDVGSAWRFTQGSNNVLLVSWDTGAGGPVGSLTDLSASRLITDARSASDETAFDELGNPNGGHGQLAVNVMAAIANNASGTTGINWKSPVLVHDLYGDYDNRATTSIRLTDSITEAMRLARQNGWKVVFQGGVQGTVWLNEARSQLEQLIQQNSDIALFAVAAGNGALDIDDTTSPDSSIFGGGIASLQTTYRNVLSVGALRPGDAENLWYQSNIGVTQVRNLTNATSVSLAWYSNYGQSLTLVAPTDAPAMDRFGTLDYFGGTSAANPNMAAIASLVWSANSNLNAAQVRQVLIDTAMDLGPAGKDTTYGNGLVNADAAVRRATALTRNQSLATLFTGRSEFA
jgi:hypothetical protein